MTNDEEKLLYELKIKGECCAGILVRMGLALRGEKNEQMAKAARTLCLGIHNGMECGALTGGALMLGLFDGKNNEMVTDLAEWFRDTYGSKYNGTNCEAITHGDRYSRTVICPAIISAVYTQARKLLCDYGYISQEQD